jgi:hypothetical protein
MTTTADEREQWRKAFDMLGPEALRLRLESRRNEYPGEYGRCAEAWLLERDQKAAAVDLARYRTIRRWTVIAGVAGVVAAAAALIAALPALRDILK